MSRNKELILENIESVLTSWQVQFEHDKVAIGYEMNTTFCNLLFSNNQGFQDQEHEYFTTLHIDTADFLADWLHCTTAAVSIFTGMATTDEGLVGNSFDWMAYHFNNSPRRTVRAMQQMGLNDKAIQGIIYLLTGRLLEANKALNIVRFEYLKTAEHFPSEIAELMA